MKKNNLTNQRFTRLHVLGLAGSSKDGRTMWLCRCDCGSLPVILGKSLLRGTTRSCGCLAAESTHSVTHGFTRNGSIPQEYSIFLKARSRCQKPGNDAYANYGGRGIEFRFESYEHFLSVVGPRPSEQHSLDRYPNNDGHYEPGNVRWATRREQSRNTRRTLYFTYNGETLSTAEWAERLGLPSISLRYRIRDGWCVECAISIPFQKGGKLARGCPYRTEDALAALLIREPGKKSFQPNEVKEAIG